MEKLIRNKLPEIALQQRGEVMKIRVASDEEFLLMLRQKLFEEATEVLNSPNKENLIEEIADVLEVLKELCEANGIVDAVFKSRIEKYEKCGGFEKKIVLVL